jgi:hypothetical protein
MCCQLSLPVSTCSGPRPVSALLDMAIVLSRLSVTASAHWPIIYDAGSALSEKAWDCVSTVITRSIVRQRSYLQGDGRYRRMVVC